MKGKFLVLLVSFFFFFNISLAQSLIEQSKKYTRADSLRGALRPERTCYDVTYYDLKVRIDTVNRSITGSNTIRFNVVNNFTTLQIDLYENMKIINITMGDQELQYRREFNAVFVIMPSELLQGGTGSITINYYGSPIVAKRPPWDGGFTWTHDNNGKLWVAVSCEGMGASLWWPCKDYLGDEPDSMRISCTVPEGLRCVSNGQEEPETENEDNTSTFHWLVSYPINNYNATLNIGDYVQLHDFYTAQDGDTLSLNYYVLSYNIDKAKKQFVQVKPMLTCYEKYLGKYPFWRDGYALVETPYLGMEHQSAIAYGNQFKTGYAGIDFSRIGLDFDYIIIHESAHEWWGNSVSCRDLADMWIHESFATYTESIYVECMYGTDMAMRYINAKKQGVSNKSPIVGKYEVNEEGDGDMYNKGMLFLNTLRHVVNNDTLWWSLIKGMCDTTFKMKNIGYSDVVNYFNTKTGMNLSPVFDQYLRYSSIPVFEYHLTKTKGKTYNLSYRWNTDVKGFEMPVFISTHDNTYKSIAVSNDWHTQAVHLTKETDFKVNEEWMYIAVKKLTIEK